MYRVIVLYEKDPATRIATITGPMDTRSRSSRVWE